MIRPRFGGAAVMVLIAVVALAVNCRPEISSDLAIRLEALGYFQ